MTAWHLSEWLSNHILPPKKHQLSGSLNWALTHLHFAIGLKQLSDRHFVLLQSPLHQLWAANVDRALYVWRVVLRKRPAVNYQQAACPSLDEACQALDVHGAPLVGPFLPCHDVGCAEWEARVKDVGMGGSGVWRTRGRWERWRKEEEIRVSGEGLPLEQALGDPWCLKEEATKKRKEN